MFALPGHVPANCSKILVIQSFLYFSCSLLSNNVVKRLNQVLGQTMINGVQGFKWSAAVDAHNSIGKRESVECVRYTIFLRNQSKTFLVAVGLNDVFHRHWPALITVEDGKLVLRTVTASILSFLKMTAQIVVSGRVTSNELDKKL